MNALFPKRIHLLLNDRVILSGGILNLGKDLLYKFYFSKRRIFKIYSVLTIIGEISHEHRGWFSVPEK